MTDIIYRRPKAEGERATYTLAMPPKMREQMILHPEVNWPETVRKTIADTLAELKEQTNG